MKMSLPSLQLLHVIRETASYGKSNECTSITVRREHVKKKWNKVYALQYLVFL
jgi:hypothetical protein